MSKQLEGIEQKDIIKRVTGKITKLYEAKTLNGPKGEFIKQGGEIEIDGTTYGLSIFNNVQPESLKGKVVVLSSVRSKHGLSGVTLEHETYDGKNGHVDRDVIKVTASGKIEIEGQVSEEPPRVASSSSHRIPELNDPAKQLDEILYMHTYVDSLVRCVYTKITDEETLRSYVASIFIEANKKGIMIRQSEPQKASIDPLDWGSVVVPSGSLKGKKLAGLRKSEITRLYQFFLEKGFTTDFAKAVEQASKDLKLDGPVEDDIPMEELPDIEF
jgi:hypothetical protein